MNDDELQFREGHELDLDELAEALGHKRCECGYWPDSFACKIRHLSINTGAAKAANDA